MTKEYFANHGNDTVENDKGENDNEQLSPSPAVVENFDNLTLNTDLLLKSVFWGAVFYLLCLPDVRKMTVKLIGKKMDIELVHAIVYGLLYFVISQLI